MNIRVVVISIGCDLLFYTTRIFVFCVLEAVYRSEHCSCLPNNVAVSHLRRRLD